MLNCESASARGFRIFESTDIYKGNQYTNRIEIKEVNLMAENNFHIIAMISIVAIVGIVGVISFTNSSITGAFGFEKRDVCRIDSCEDAVEGVCDMKKDQGAAMENINDIRADCGLGRQLSFHEIKSLCNTFGVEDAVQNACTPGQCIVNADCDDGNSCTTEFCSTGLRGGCITGTPVGDGTSCQIGGQLGVCEGSTCVPSGETCEPVPGIDECLNTAMETYEFCLNVGGDLEGCRERMKQVLEDCGIGGACADLSSSPELQNLPQCCTEIAPNNVICGAFQEWVVGIAAVPTCYIQNS